MTAAHPRVRAELALIAVTLIWGVTFVIIKKALNEVSTLIFIAMRFSLAAACLVVFFRRRLMPDAALLRNTWVGGTLAGCCLFGGYYFQTLGLRFTTPSKSAFITGLTTVLVPFLAAFVYRNAPHWVEAAGVITATSGLGLLTLPPGTISIGYGDALTLCCTVAFAAHILVLGRWASRSSFEALSVLQIGVTALLALLVCGWAEPVTLVWSPALILAIAATGILATALAFTVMAWAQRHTSPSRAALIFALEPVSAAVTSYLVDGERLTARSISGAILILAGVLMVELKPMGAREHH